MKKEKDKLGHIRFEIFHKKTSEYIGFIELINIKRFIHQEAEISYAIFNKHQRQGYATESLRSLMEYAFSELNLHRLYALIHPKNHRSQKLIKTLGYQYEGLRRGACFYPDRDNPKKGKWEDMKAYSFLK